MQICSKHPDKGFIVIGPINFVGKIDSFQKWPPNMTPILWLVVLEVRCTSVGKVWRHISSHIFTNKKLVRITCNMVGHFEDILNWALLSKSIWTRLYLTDDYETSLWTVNLHLEPWLGTFQNKVLHQINKKTPIISHFSV